MITAADKIALYKGRVLEAIESIKASEVAALIEALRGVRERGAAVYVVGNGGSYANAQHLVLHLRDARIRAFDLMADNAWLTAESNDRSYASACRQLYTKLAGKDDWLVAISGSGKSKNIIEALYGAGMPCVGLLGFGGGEALELCNVAVVLPQTEYGPVEDAHSVVIHAIHEALK